MVFSRGCSSAGLGPHRNRAEWGQATFSNFFCPGFYGFYGPSKSLLAAFQKVRRRLGRPIQSDSQPAVPICVAVEWRD